MPCTCPTHKLESDTGNRARLLVGCATSTVGIWRTTRTWAVATTPLQLHRHRQDRPLSIAQTGRGEATTKTLEKDGGRRRPLGHLGYFVGRGSHMGKLGRFWRWDTLDPRSYSPNSCAVPLNFVVQRSLAVLLLQSTHIHAASYGTWPRKTWRGANELCVSEWEERAKPGGVHCRTKGV